ncbi:hypothetical protein [Sulfurospirillum diekertiae]|uniref:Uncharacterized protein n=1 Tax=Sulfurospirillum diekertiae TaxID=1854492 RepID=A0A1Y0HJR4_9BACT|nr:hypothetical protein [Sulfurospirillum diekertiae]ARU47585.1 hypothetical protein Sdiek1_0403 [Sulfurospirillum diekertiae]ASC92432.1 hypothetical protein Sdiek2_0395 [Sulfurospirillum diekertiae]
MALNPLLLPQAGNTIDSTWAFPRKFSDKLGWAEMDYLAYHMKEGKAVSGRGDPLNRKTHQGEFGYFLKHVVGANLYGVMPSSMEAFLVQTITQKHGYSDDWRALDVSHLETLVAQQRLHVTLMGEFVDHKAYLTPEGFIQPSLLYPSEKEALSGAIGYRKVVVTERFTLGKDIFAQTPFTFRYARVGKEAYTHLNGTPYKIGEIITDRPIEKEAILTQGAGITETLIDEKDVLYDGEYLPLLNYPLVYEKVNN